MEIKIHKLGLGVAITTCVRVSGKPNARELLSGLKLILDKGEVVFNF